MTESNTKRKILIVEDEKPLRDVYEIILTSAGYEVVSAMNGLEALDIVEHAEPEFVLLDLFMPVMNGLEFMKAVKPDERPNMTIVVFSNNSDSGVSEEAARLGARDVILKSDISPTKLIELVNDYL